MAGVASIGGVGAGLSQAQFQAQYQVRVLDLQQSTKALGAVALELVQSAMASTGATGGTQGHDLDVKA